MPTEGRMTAMWRSILAGAAAGVTGTAALNGATFLDMAVRGRPASRTPERSVEALVAKAGLSIPGDRERQSNRIQGVAGLLGLATGAGVGATLGSVDSALGGVLGRLPVVGSGPVFTGAALIAANGPMSGLDVTDPRTWRPSDWASDVIPHVAFGLVAAMTYRALRS